MMHTIPTSLQGLRVEIGKGAFTRTDVLIHPPPPPLTHFCYTLHKSA